MSAFSTLSQVIRSDNLRSAPVQPLQPRHGVIALCGYGSSVTVDRGHLLLRDVIAGVEHKARLPRVGHELRRLVVLGSDGFVSLAALRWLSEQKAAFVMLERDGSILVATGPVRSSDSRLRRAQALAHHSAVATPIVRGLLDQKLAAQERLVRDRLGDATTAQIIATARGGLATAEAVDVMRSCEAQAAHAYWSAWSQLPVTFPRRDLARVPDHWRTFGSRRSQLSGSPRLAVNPPNAMLNYLYAVLESEARLAAAALGLDPGMGVLHVDTATRDSFACDLMEPIRPQVDTYVLDWMMREPSLRREWLFEQSNGNCRLMGSFVAQLSHTAPVWARAIAPIAEGVAELLWSTVQKPSRESRLASRLTQRHRRAAQGAPASRPELPSMPPRMCQGCGATLKHGRTQCAHCEQDRSTKVLVEAAVEGRALAQSPAAQARRSAARQRHAAAERAWRASDQPSWLTADVYRLQIVPKLQEIKLKSLMSALGVSEPYAINVRAGRRQPHPRHWFTLATLTGIARDLT